jgi:hypothetical protein
MNPVGADDDVGFDLAAVGKARRIAGGTCLGACAR